ncbi:precorrin-2 C(20)-methyltransferase [Acetobacter orientalis]|uniref:precorrin-2 C(20)-methyltransferase n=1 Tax=Acetobacter orientalis TaxID=146474 RepID=UPI0020A540BC|nr:precorrin-2 C(20)-methyltransferase [Acetobacter orientalis]MCP1221418.1 precorrin-2 C(20)-methyltransferase [Acetobacter orientalis]
MVPNTAHGTLHVVGVGPGDPELLTVKAAKTLKAAKVIAHFCKHDKKGHARTIAEPYLAPTVRELRLAYPFTIEVAVEDPEYQRGIQRFYDACAEQLADVLAQGQDVVLLCEGEPFLYGSAMYLFDRLKERFQTVVVPGIAAMNGCWSQAQLPMTHGDDVLCVLPATLPEADLTKWLKQADAAVLMKIGRNMPKVRRALAQSGRMPEARYVERGTQENGFSQPFSDCGDTAPYFSLVLVPGRKGAR